MKLSQRQNKLIRSLHTRKGRDQHQMCLIEGERSVRSALHSGAELELLVHSSEYAGSAALRAATAAGIDVAEVDTREMARLSDVRTPQGILAVARNPLVDARALLDFDTILILDGIQDPGNAGTLIRTAAWFGLDGILAAEGTVDLFSPKVVRSTMGGLWDIRMARTSSIVEWISAWKKGGGSVAAGEMKGIELAEWRPAVKTALIIGGEANGLSAATQEFVDQHVFIYGAGKSGENSGVESLNAAVAGGILLSYWHSSR